MIDNKVSTVEEHLDWLERHANDGLTEQLQHARDLAIAELVRERCVDLCELLAEPLDAIRDIDLAELLK